MPRTGVKGLQTNAATGQNLSQGYNAAGTGIASNIVPALEREVTNPQGFSMPGLTAMNTAAMQAGGGSTAGAVGQGNLEAARTRNPGAFTTALDESARSGQRTAADEALGVQIANERQRQQNQQRGYSGLEGLYGMDTDAALRALGLSNQGFSGAAQANALGNQSALGWAKLGVNAATGAGNPFGL